MNKFDADIIANTISHQWAQLKELNTSLRVLSEHPLHLRVSKTSDTNRVFIFRFNKEPLNLVLPTLKSMEVSKGRNGNQVDVIFELRDGEFSDVFDTFLFDLVASSINATTEMAAMIVVQRLKRWSELFKSRIEDKLSAAEILGLRAELSVVRQLLKSGWDHHVVIKGWRGPEGDATDIGLDSMRIEVKASWATSHNRVEISSADQLDTDEKPLFLARILLNASDDAGESINDLVRSIEGMIEANGSSPIEFRSKLMLAGFVDERDQFDESYEESEGRWYEIRDGFPRITTEMLAPQITNVRYRIELGTLNEFLVASETVLDQSNAK